MQKIEDGYFDDFAYLARAAKIADRLLKMCLKRLDVRREVGFLAHGEDAGVALSEAEIPRCRKEIGTSATRSPLYLASISVSCVYV